VLATGPSLESSMRAGATGKATSMVTASIIVANYNNAKYLKRCLDSALSQTRPADEIIVYDDGSNDESVEIIKSYGGRIKTLFGTHNPVRRSRVSAANGIYRAFLETTSDWCFLLDGDDAFHPKKLEKYLEAAERNPDASLIQAPMVLIDSEGKETGVHRNHSSHSEDQWRRIAKLNDCDFFYPTSSLAVHRRVYELELPFDFSVAPELANDIRTGIASMFHGRVVTLDTPLSQWRRHAKSLSGASAKSRWYLMSLAADRAAVFNRYAQIYGKEKISPWRSRKTYFRLALAIMPKPMARLFRKARHDVFTSPRLGIVRR
jgi:glycosyltransferase involved in cell wall biosynthesis